MKTVQFLLIEKKWINASSIEVTLLCEQDHFDFQNGQWIDFFAPIEGKNIGGYTITSIKKDLPKLKLIVKRSLHHPVTKFIHEKFEINDKIKLSQAQGKFILTNLEFDFPPLFIAGGIGITPIISMMRELIERKINFRHLHSISNNDDVILKEEFEKFSTYFVTKEPPCFDAINRRINKDDILKNFIVGKTSVFICGPKTMIEEMLLILSDLRHPKELIHYEKWW